MTIPEKPKEDTDGAWLDWAQKHFPYNQKFADKMRITRVRPQVGSELELKLISTIPDSWRGITGYLARLWFDGLERVREIEAAQAEDRRKQQEAERARLIGLAKDAAAGRLGWTDAQKEDARATANGYLPRPPEACSVEELSDWWQMHKYAKAIASGRNPPRPRLHAERKADAQRSREVDEIGESLGAVQGELGW